MNKIFHLDIICTQYIILKLEGCFTKHSNQVEEWFGNWSASGNTSETSILSQV